MFFSCFIGYSFSDFFTEKAVQNKIFSAFRGVNGTAWSVISFNGSPSIA